MRPSILLSFAFLAATASVFGAVDNNLLALVPPGVKIISSIDVEHARSSQFGQYLLSRINSEDQHFQKLNQETGFDPRRDLQDFVFASTGSSGEDGQPRFAILARGTFDPNRIKAAAKANGAVLKTYQGVEMILDNSSQEKTGFAFPDIGVAVMADATTLRQIIANRANPTALEPAVQSMVSKIGPDNDAWFVSLMSGSYLTNHLAEETKQPIQQAQALQSILQSSGGIRFGDTVQLSFDAITRSPKDATSLADVVRFVASMIQMERQNDPRADILASSLDKMNLTTDADAIHVSISLPEKSLEQLAEVSPLGSSAKHHHAQ